MALNDNVGGLQITDKDKMTVTTVESDMAGISAALQTKLRTLANGDVLYYVNILKDVNSNKCVAYIVFEDQ